MSGMAPVLSGRPARHRRFNPCSVSVRTCTRADNNCCRGRSAESPHYFWLQTAIAVAVPPLQVTAQAFPDIWLEATRP